MNLAVKDLDRFKAFFERLGFTFNPQFTDETVACMVVTDDIYAMLLTHPKFKEFTKKDVADAHKTTEVLTCLSFDSKEKVNEILDNAVACRRHGGARAAGLRLDVWSQLQRPRRPYLGNHLDGPDRIRRSPGLRFPPLKSAAPDSKECDHRGDQGFAVYQMNLEMSFKN